MADEEFDPGGRSVSFGPTGSSPASGPTGELYDPGGASKSILSTSFKKLPTTEGGDGTPWEKLPATEFGYGQDPWFTTGTGPAPQQPDTPLGRTFKAAAQGWEDAKLLTPEARVAAESGPAGFFGKFTNPIATLEELPLKAASALGSGLVQGAYEIGSTISPSLGRALATLAIVAPAAENPSLRLSPRDMNLPYGFRDIAGPLPPEAIPRPDPGVAAKATGKAPGAERIPPEMPTSLPQRVTASDIKTVEDARYGNVTRSTDVTSADAVNRAVDLALPSSVADAARREFGKDSIIGKHIDIMESLKGKDLSIQRWKGYDQTLSDDAYASTTTDAQRNQLLAIQRNLRGSLEKPFPGDLSAGDGSGYTNLQAARQAASQRMKMHALEEIARTSRLRVNEPQSVRSKIATFLSNEDNIRGWSQDEIAAATRAQTTSQLYDLVHSMGSRLGVGVAAGTALSAAIASGNPMAFLGVPAAAAGAWAGGALPRAIENAVVRKRLNDALTVLGKSVPVEPMNPNLVPRTPAPAFVPDTRVLPYSTLFPGAPRQQD